MLAQIKANSGKLARTMTLSSRYSFHNASRVGATREPAWSFLGIASRRPRSHQPSRVGTALPPAPPASSLWVLGKTERLLPVKLELSFGTPIASAADSEGGERKGRERRVHSWRYPQGSSSPAPATPRPAAPPRCTRPGTKRSAAAPPSGTRGRGRSVRMLGVLPCLPHSHTEQRHGDKR